MRRVEGWEKRLNDLIDSVRNRPFAWGTHDCVTFAMSDYAAMLGKLPVGAPAWNSMEEAIELLSQKSITEWVSQIAGEPIEGWKLARRGDVLLVETRNINLARDVIHYGILGVKVYNGIAVLGPDGIKFVPSEMGMTTWRIGE